MQCVVRSREKAVDLTILQKPKHGEIQNTYIHV